VGLVKTVEYFGVQGEVPPYRELLDWLAAEFIESGWDVKALMRVIVTSETYQQFLKVTDA
jgi:replicative superfamily II helicase